jgi:hypothetical protein
MKKIIATILLGAVSGFTPAASAITSTDAANILFLKQEEKLARDVYQALYEKWGHTTFANIKVSEQRHMDAVDGLIARYRLTDPTPPEAGQFTYTELQELYAQLIAKGELSLKDALEVGVLIEDLDIEDIQEMLDATTVSVIRRVLTNLQNGSYNHLAAFNNALDQLAASQETGTAVTGSATRCGCQPVCPTSGKGQRQRGRH